MTNDEPGSVRAAMLRALRSAAQFEVPEATLEECLAATPELLGNPERIATAEALVRSTLASGVPLPATQRAFALPVLGNIAEAVIESILAEIGWQPCYDDDAGSASGHGVDLLMLDPSLERVVAIEVKSTIQRGRWPRLASGDQEQLTPSWFDAPGNQGMVEWQLGSADIYTMVVQVHLRRRLWRSCLAADPLTPQPIVDFEQLSDLDWLT